MRPRLLARSPRASHCALPLAHWLLFALCLETLSSLALFKPATSNSELISIFKLRAALLACWLRLLAKAARHNNNKAQGTRRAEAKAASSQAESMRFACAQFSVVLSTLLSIKFLLEITCRTYTRKIFHRKLIMDPYMFLKAHTYMHRPSDVHSRNSQFSQTPTAAHH